MIVGPASFNLVATSTTGATRATMLTWLQGLVGTGVIAVQQLAGQSTGDGSNGLQAVFNASGKWPGGVGINYYNNDFSMSPEGFGTQGNATGITWWQNGGIVLLSGFNFPSPGVPGGGCADTRYGPGVDGAQVTTPGTAAYNQWISTLSQVAAGMQELVNAGVVFLFRPLHEMNQGFWWWNIISDAQYVALWKITYNYLMVTRGFGNNIIWIWAPNGNTPRASQYPGDGFVDVVAFDYYDGSPVDQGSCYNSLTQFGKPVGWGEWGGNYNVGEDEMVIVNALKTIPRTVYWEQWSFGWAISQASNLNTALNDSWILTRDRLNRPK